MDCHAAKSASRRTVATRPDGGWPIEHRRANDHSKAAVCQLFEFDVLLVPNRHQRLYRRAPRLRLALLKLVDRSLGQADAQPKLGLAPAEHSAGQTNFCSKAMPLDPKDLTEIV